MPNQITLTGFKELENKLDNLPAQLNNEIDGEIKYAAEEWAGFAKRDAPKNFGFLAGQIDAKKVSQSYWEVISGAEYSAYMEWGTRQRVSVPADLQAYASEFRGKGGGGDVKKFIYLWCERKGIPKSAWWPIFISLMTKGVNPHPFFFIQRPIIEKLLVERVTNILKTPH